MTANHPSSADHADLHALVDGRLPPAKADQARSALDVSAQQQAAAWQQQRERLQALHRDWLQQPAPDALLRAAARVEQTHAAQQRWAVRGGVAAGWLLAFGLGWSLHGTAQNPSHMAAASASAPMRFAHQAALAHAVFQPEQRHPVEVTAAEQDHLVQWLSKRLARPLKVPNLQQQGFTLMGGRLLPGGDAAGSARPADASTATAARIAQGARAQFMYQSADGTRITLYLGALEHAQATAFQFHEDGAVSSFYWIDHGFGYALSGALPRPALQALAAEVHRQLSSPSTGANAPASDS